MNTQLAYLTPKTYSKNLLVWETNPSQGSKNIENTLVPILAQDREVSEGLKLKDGIGRKNIHWSSVFL